MTRLTNLTHLSLCNNRLERLPDEIGSLTSLVSMNVQLNRLTSLPESISTLDRLETLNASHNAIGKLPGDMWPMKRLRVLNLNRNRLRGRLPESLSDLRSLTTLKLAHNEIDEIPEDICASTCLRKSLRVLWLHSNQMIRLPRRIGMLSNMKTLRTDLNPLRSPPPGIIRAGIKQIRKYMRIRRRRVRALYRQFNSLGASLDVKRLDPVASNVLSNGTGHLTESDLRRVDTLVDEYVNAAFYKRTSVTDETVISYFRTTLRERNNAYHLRCIDSFYDMIGLIRKYDLLPGSLFTTKIKLPWGEKRAVTVRETPATSDERGEGTETVSASVEKSVDDDTAARNRSEQIEHRRLVRRCFGIVLTSVRTTTILAHENARSRDAVRNSQERVMGPSKSSRAEYLNTIFRKRKIKVRKSDPKIFQFPYTRAEVEASLEQYRGVYGRVSKPEMVQRFRLCTCGPRDILRYVEQAITLFFAAFTPLTPTTEQVVLRAPGVCELVGRGGDGGATDARDDETDRHSRDASSRKGESSCSQRQSAALRLGRRHRRPMVRGPWWRR